MFARLTCIMGCQTSSKCFWTTWKILWLCNNGLMVRLTSSLAHVTFTNNNRGLYSLNCVLYSIRVMFFYKAELDHNKHPEGGKKHVTADNGGIFNHISTWRVFSLFGQLFYVCEDQSHPLHHSSLVWLKSPFLKQKLKKTPQNLARNTTNSHRITVLEQQWQ